jgi:RNA polymerase sigma factor (sigma-70 family)
LGKSAGQLVEHLFRTEAGRLVSILTKIFGPTNIQLAEDVVQETLISALDSWCINGIPDNPSAWLMQVAKRKVMNEFKRLKVTDRYKTIYQSLPDYYNQQFDEFFLENEIEDSQLRMIFTCCHPSLSVASQIALTLKTLCGFGIKEVANALLTTETTVNKRLYRSKKAIRESNVPFIIPSGKELDKRIESVCLTLYLLFNEGYNSSGSSSIIKKELCFEAIRLTKLLTEHFETVKPLYALLSLMCFHASRFDARIDDRRAIIIFEEQNRMLWNKELIAQGLFYLGKSSNHNHLSTYHLEAGIAAEHSIANSFEQTNWQAIFDYYEMLYKLKPSPIIRLNLAIIQSKLKGELTSLFILDELEHSGELENYFLLPATQGVFYLRLRKFNTALSYFQKAIDLTNSPMQIRLLKQKIGECHIPDNQS